MSDSLELEFIRSLDDLPALDIKDAEVDLTVPRQTATNHSEQTDSNQTGPHLNEIPGPWRKITVLKAALEGKRLTKEDVITMIFLLGNNPQNALELCKEVEAGKYPNPCGSYFMASLVKQGEDLNFKLWDLKIICCLHLMGYYRTIRNLVGMSKEEVLSNFRDKEYFYLTNNIRLSLFHVLNGLTKAESEPVLLQTWKDLGNPVSFPWHPSPEMNLLQIFAQNKAGEEWPFISKFVSKLNLHLPSSKVDKLPINYSSSVFLRHGFCVILNQGKFEANSDFKDRNGSNLDRDRLKTIFEQFDCEVVVLQDLKEKEIKNEFRRIAQKDWKQYGFLVVAILSHGDIIDHKDVVYGTDGKPVHLEEDIFQHFNHRDLVEKLRLFIVQACRGQNEAGTGLGSSISQDGGGGKMPSFRNGKHQPLHVNNNVIKHYSTVPGYVSYRNFIKGAHFIQMLCREIELNAHYYPILDLFNKANDNMKAAVPLQVPMMTITFSTKCYFYNTLYKPETNTVQK